VALRDAGVHLFVRLSVWAPEKRAAANAHACCWLQRCWTACIVSLYLSLEIGRTRDSPEDEIGERYRKIPITT